MVDGLFAAVATTLDDAQDVRQALRALADGYLRGLLQPDVVRLRRLVIAEADRFPEIGCRKNCMNAASTPIRPGTNGAGVTGARSCVRGVRRARGRADPAARLA